MTIAASNEQALGRRLRLGMVGGGRGAFIGAVHRIAARLDDRWELVAGALSSDPERSRMSGQDLLLKPDRVYDDYNEMARRERRMKDGIDAVAIVTPNHAHAAAARAFLKAGIHVICDKPLTTTRREADLLARLAKSPRDISIALSTSLGNSNHVAVAKVIRHAGADTKAPPIRVFDTALDAVADVVAGHADVGAITAASSVPEIEAGRLRTLAISSPVRLPGVYAEAPTWMEQGVDCVVGSWRGASGPPGLGDEQISFWRGVLAKATATPEWKGDLARLFWIPMYLDGGALRDYLTRERGEMRAVLAELGLLSG